MTQLKELYYLLHLPTLDQEKICRGEIEGLSLADHVRLEISQQIVKKFLLYPTLRYIAFDVNKIEELSKVWEGSTEDPIEINYPCHDNQEAIENSTHYKNYHVDSEYKFHRYIKKLYELNKEKTIYPYFEDIKDALEFDGVFTENTPISFLNGNNYHNHVKKELWVLGEDSEIIEEICNQLYKNKEETEFCFEPEGKYLYEDIMIFMGPKVKAFILNHKLENTLPHTNSVKSKSQKI